MSSRTPDREDVAGVIPISFYSLKYAKRARQRLGAYVNSYVLVADELTVD